MGLDYFLVNRQTSLWKETLGESWIAYRGETEFLTCAYVVVWCETRERSFQWRRRSFQGFVGIWERRKASWRGYWVFLIKPYKALNRGGGTSQYTRNVRCSFSWPSRTEPLLETTNPAGRSGSALSRLSKIVLHGNLKLVIFAGLLMGRSVRGGCERVGKRRWSYAGNAKCFKTRCRH